jgi:hypothetical protein
VSEDVLAEVARVLGEHRWVFPKGDSRHCACGWNTWGVRTDLWNARMAAHQAQALADVLAKVWDEGFDSMRRDANPYRDEGPR